MSENNISSGMRHVTLLRALHRAVPALLAVSFGSCGGGNGNPSGPSGGEGRSTFTGTAVIGDAGSFWVSYDVNPTSAGDLDAEVSWSVTAPGHGRNAGNQPVLGLNFIAVSPFHNCLGLGLPTVCVQSPYSSSSPVRLRFRTDASSRYELSIGENYVCGGCTIQYTLAVTHPSAAITPAPPRSCGRWIVEPLRGGDGAVYPEIDLGASPATARLRIGERARIGVTGLECSGRGTHMPSYQPVQWSANGSVAAVTELPLDFGAVNAELRAVGRGETRPQATLITQDGTSETAEFSYCDGCVSATPLRLVVVR